MREYEIPEMKISKFISESIVTESVIQNEADLLAEWKQQEANVNAVTKVLDFRADFNN